MSEPGCRPGAPLPSWNRFFLFFWIISLKVPICFCLGLPSLPSLLRSNNALAFLSAAKSLSLYSESESVIIMSRM